jgi:ribonucleoside-diphosphate reductase alpha chain
MRTGEQKVARAYVIYRDQRATARKQALKSSPYLTNH